MINKDIACLAPLLCFRFARFFFSVVAYIVVGTLHGATCFAVAALVVLVMPSTLIATFAFDYGDIVVAIYSLHIRNLLSFSPFFLNYIVVVVIAFVIVVVLVSSSTLIATFIFALVYIVVATYSLHICPLLTLSTSSFHIVVVVIVAITFVVVFVVSPTFIAFDVIVAMDSMFLILLSILPPLLFLHCCCDCC